MLLRILSTRISGEEHFDFIEAIEDQPTIRIPAIPPKLTHQSGEQITNYTMDTPMRALSLCHAAIVHHQSMSRGIDPQCLRISPEIYNALKQDIENIYRQNFRGQIPFISTSGTIKSVHITVGDSLSKYTVTCIH